MNGDKISVFRGGRREGGSIVTDRPNTLVCMITFLAFVSLFDSFFSLFNEPHSELMIILRPTLYALYALCHQFSKFTKIILDVAFSK